MSNGVTDQSRNGDRLTARFKDLFDRHSALAEDVLTAMDCQAAGPGQQQPSITPKGDLSDEPAAGDAGPAAEATGLGGLDFATLCPPGLRDEVTGVASELRRLTERLRGALDRASTLEQRAVATEHKVRSQLVNSGVQLSMRAEEGLGLFLYELAGARSLHDALSELEALVNSAGRTATGSEASADEAPSDTASGTLLDLTANTGLAPEN